MDTRSKSSRVQPIPDVTDAPALWRSAFKGSEDWIRPAFAVLEDVQAASQRWMMHRFEDIQKAVDASRQMAECKDLAQAAAIQQKWLAECTERLVADWTVLVRQAGTQTSQHGEGSKKAPE